MTVYSVFASLAPAALVLLVVVIAALWRRRAAPGGIELVVALSAGVLWLGFAFGEIAAPTAETSAWMVRAAYLAIPWGPALWLAFAMRFTGHPAWRNPAVGIVCGIGAVTMWLGLAGSPALLDVERSVEVGSFRYNEVAFGPWFWVHIASSWGATVLGAGVIALEFVRSPKPYRHLAIWLAIAAALPLLVNVTYAGGLHPAGKLYTPLSFALSALAFGYGMIRYRLLDLQPATRSALMDRVSEGLVVLDAEGRVVDFNPAFGALAPGLEPGASLASSPLATLGEGAAGEVLLGGRHIEWRGDDAEAGRVRVVLLRDVTERREAEAALRRANVELRLRNEELDAYAHTVAHDLKTPLQAIAGSAEILRLGGAARAPGGSPGGSPEVGTSDDDRHDRAIHRIATTAAQMNQSLDDLLLLASVRQDDRPPVALAMDTIVARALVRESARIEAAEATVEVPADWPVARGHAPWVEEIWVNLLSNAVKYGGEPPRIAIGCEPADARHRFWVDDDGPGIPAEARERVFAPLTRLSPGRAEGTGLGLAIVRRIATRLGGTVTVEPSPLGGTRFVFTLPAACPPPPRCRGGRTPFRTPPAGGEAEGVARTRCGATRTGDADQAPHEMV